MTSYRTSLPQKNFEDPAWQSWLAERSSFAFQSKDGHRFTARKETRARGNSYWVAYRKVGGKLTHTYIDRSEVVTLARLEQVARFLAGQANQDANSLPAQEQQALPQLREAVRLAQPEGYIRSFVDEGVAMATLLSALRDQQRKQGPTPYLDTLLAAFSPAPLQVRGTGRPASHSSIRLALLDPLSPREREVLHLLARGASNQEIAEELVVTLDTVKRHVSNMLSKLGASNRTQALSQARQLGLLSPERHRSSYGRTSSG